MENPVAFYASYIVEFVAKHLRFGVMYWNHRRILKRVEADSNPYLDLAIAPVQPREFEDLDLYRATPAARTAADKFRRRSTSQPAAKAAARAP